ncbi:MAG: gliding motility-associated C-terminal domain-containing protein [Chitinophagaceae bacterium]|nr:gliding motility-associated C-terminal domain-containing protein [Chitinophagaceae bacterium]
MRIFIRMVFCLILLADSSFAQEFKAAPFLSQDIFQTDYFIENKGQFDQPISKMKPVHFAIDHKGMIIYFNSSGFVWELKKAIRKSETQIESEKIDKADRIHKYIFQEDKITMNWLYGNKNCVIETFEKSSHYFPYGESKLNSYGFKKIRYSNLYNHIDVDYVIHPKGGIEYSLILNKGFDLTQVQFEYPNHPVTLKNNQLRIQTQVGDWEEKELKAFYEDGTAIACAYTMKNQQIGFEFLEPINKNKKIIIDPWVTPITTLTNIAGNGSNRGFDVDYDYAGNLYVFGGGDYFGSSVNSKVAKYSPTGALLWTFNGVLVSPSWNSGAVVGKVSNFVVDKLSGKFYMGQGWVSTGTVIVRCDANGNYDNFISTANSNFEELWEMNFDCSNGKILGFGGGTTTNINLGVIDALGGFTMSNVSGAAPGFQDILNSTISGNGEIFVAMACGNDTSLNNVLIHVNTTLNGNNWIMPSGVASFNEADNKPYLSPYASNGFNALHVNQNFLYYYDGNILKAYSKATGLAVGNPYTISGFVLKNQGGIYADECDHVYVGGDNGNIKVFLFDGTNFNVLPDIQISGVTGHVYDIKYHSANGLLYISGQSFVATEPRSQVCIDTTSLNASLTIDCLQASIHLNNADPSAQYTYIWTDSITNTVVQNHNGAGMIDDTLLSITNGKVYHVLVIKNALCGGSSQTFRFVGANYLNIYTSPILCNGQQCVVNGHTYSQSGQYSDTLKASIGCDTIIHTNLTILPQSTFSQQIDLCKGQQIVINGHTYSATGFYIDTVKTAIGCDSIIQTDLKVNEISYSNQQVVLCNGNTFKVGNHVYSSSGTYVDTLQNAAGCDSIITSFIKVDSTSASSFYIPNAFSPNGDKTNDCFGMKHWPILESFSLIIYNRWGQQVYATKSTQECWDGRFAGRNADIGVYYYYIKAKTTCGDIIKKGDINLIR